MKYQRKIESSTIDGMYVICSFYEMDFFFNLLINQSINQSINLIKFFLQSSILIFNEKIKWKTHVNFEGLIKISKK